MINQDFYILDTNENKTHTVYLQYKNEANQKRDRSKVSFGECDLFSFSHPWPVRSRIYF